mgnify:CR=1 FL=1
MFFCSFLYDEFCTNKSSLHALVIVSNGKIPPNEERKLPHFYFIYFFKFRIFQIFCSGDKKTLQLPYRVFGLTGNFFFGSFLLDGFPLRRNTL